MHPVSGGTNDPNCITQYHYSIVSPDCMAQYRYSQLSHMLVLILFLINIEAWKFYSFVVVCKHFQHLQHQYSVSMSDTPYLFTKSHARRGVKEKSE